MPPGKLHSTACTILLFALIAAPLRTMASTIDTVDDSQKLALLLIVFAAGTIKQFYVDDPEATLESKTLPDGNTMLAIRSSQKRHPSFAAIVDGPVHFLVDDASGTFSESISSPGLDKSLTIISPSRQEVKMVFTDTPVISSDDLQSAIATATGDASVELRGLPTVDEAKGISVDYTGADLIAIKSSGAASIFQQQKLYGRPDRLMVLAPLEWEDLIEKTTGQLEVLVTKAEQEIDEDGAAADRLRKKIEMFRTALSIKKRLLASKLRRRLDSGSESESSSESGSDLGACTISDAEVGKSYESDESDESYKSGGACRSDESHESGSDGADESVLYAELNELGSEFVFMTGDSIELELKRYERMLGRRLDWQFEKKCDLDEIKRVLNYKRKKAQEEKQTAESEQQPLEPPVSDAPDQ